MEVAEEKSKNIFLQITQGIPKTIVYSLITAIVIGTITFSYAFAKQTGNTNKEFPAEQAKTNLINLKVDKLTIDVELLKNNGANTNQKVNDITEEQKSQREILLQILYRANQINNNTK